MREIVKELSFLLQENPYLLSSEEDFSYFHSNALEEISSNPIKTKKEVAPFSKEPLLIPKEQKIAIKEEPISSLKNPIIEKKEPQASISSEKKAPPSSTLGFSQIRKTLQRVDPNLLILDQIPSDEIAKKLATRWKTKNQAADFSILSAFETIEQKRFLTSIAQALDVYFSKAKLIDAEKIEKENQWESFLSTEGLKMILICDSTLWQLPKLKSLYKENPSQGTRFLQKVPLFLLPDLSLYFKDTRLKRSLWNSLCQKCLQK